MTLSVEILHRQRQEMTHQPLHDSQFEHLGRSLKGHSADVSSDCAEQQSKHQQACHDPETDRGTELGVDKNRNRSLGRSVRYREELLNQYDQQYGECRARYGRHDICCGQSLSMPIDVDDVGGIQS